MLVRNTLTAIIYGSCNTGALIVPFFRDTPMSLASIDYVTNEDLITQVKNFHRN